MTPSNDLVETLYLDLRRIAGNHLRRWRPGTTLQPTVLLHEAYLRIHKTEPGNFTSRTRFLATASCVMRGVLVDYVRERRARKRGGDWDRVSLELAAETI